LRVFFGPNESELPATLPMERNVTLSLGEILTPLLDAVRNNRTWVRDFADEQITISTDLHEMLLAYEHFRRPSA